MKTNQLKHLAVAVCAAISVQANALDSFECVRALIPISEQAAIQGHRKGVEKPFMINDRYMAFPEVRDGIVSGFFIYSAGHAAYYDAIEVASSKAKRSLADLRQTNKFSLYNLIAQPLGLETVSLAFMPALGSRESNGEGPVMLGSSVLPVVGAMISRPADRLTAVYRNPSEIGEADLKQFVREHSSRLPAGNVELDRQIAHLATMREKSKEELWKPLKDEVEVRKTWVKTHNLDETAFRQLARVMDSSCKP